MFADEFEQIILENNYTKFIVENIDIDVRVYVLRDKNNAYRQLIVLNHEKGKRMGGNFLEEFATQIADVLYKKGATKVNTFCLILTNDPSVEMNYGKEDSKVKNYEDCKYPYWIVDTKNRRLMIFENQPEDFYGLKTLVENMLEGRVKAKGSKQPFIPVVTILLVIINVCAFIALEIKGSTLDVDFMYKMGALSPESIIEKHEVYRVLFAMFMHFGFEHLVSNMFMLVVLGYFVEKAVKGLPYLIMYLVSGAIGSMVSSSIMYNNGQSETVCAGASGAVYGIMGVYLVLMVLYVLRVPPQIRKAEMINTLVRIAIVVGLTVSVSFYDKGIDVTAHVAGMISGVVISILWILIILRRASIISINKE